MPVSVRSRGPGSTEDYFSGAFFHLEVGGITVGYFSECSGLRVEYEVMEYQEGGQNGFVHKLRGPAKYSNIILKRGVTSDTALSDWFRAAGRKVERKEGVITLLTPALEPLRRWSFTGAFPVKWEGPGLKASSGEVAVETLELAHEGFEPAD
jgi:phage tail-like protein